MKDISDIDRRKQRDFDDLQNEIAGRETGRYTRFLPEGPRSEQAKRKEREERAFRTRLAELLADPIYRTKYDGVLVALGNAERATDAALAQIETLLHDAEEALQDIQTGAARLPDGTRVYRDGDGNVRREDGSIVDPVLAETILWRGDEPSYEAFVAGRDRLDGLRAQQAEVEGYRGNLGAIRDRVEDPDDPPSLGELEGILADIETDMPDVVRDRMVEDQPEATQTKISPALVPDLSAGN